MRHGGGLERLGFANHELPYCHHPFTFNLRDSTYVP